MFIKKYFLACFLLCSLFFMSSTLQSVQPTAIATLLDSGFVCVYNTMSHFAFLISPEMLKVVVIQAITEVESLDSVYILSLETSQGAKGIILNLAGEVLQHLE